MLLCSSVMRWWQVRSWLCSGGKAALVLTAIDPVAQSPADGASANHRNTGWRFGARRELWTCWMLPCRHKHRCEMISESPMHYNHPRCAKHGAVNHSRIDNAPLSVCYACPRPWYKSSCNGGTRVPCNTGVHTGVP